MIHVVVVVAGAKNPHSHHCLVADLLREIGLITH